MSDTSTNADGAPMSNREITDAIREIQHRIAIMDRDYALRFARLGIAEPIRDNSITRRDSYTHHDVDDFYRDEKEEKK